MLLSNGVTNRSVDMSRMFLDTNCKARMLQDSSSPQGYYRHTPTHVSTLATESIHYERPINVVNGTHHPPTSQGLKLVPASRVGMSRSHVPTGQSSQSELLQFLTV